MRYGLPYKGSKNSIAEWVVDNLPKADVFCDLFFGGGAITHRAMLDFEKVVAEMEGRSILPLLTSIKAVLAEYEAETAAMMEG